MKSYDNPTYIFDDIENNFASDPVINSTNAIVVCRFSDLDLSDLTDQDLKVVKLRHMKKIFKLIPDQNNIINIGNLPVGRYLFTNGTSKKYIYVIFNSKSDLDSTFISKELLKKHSADKHILDRYRFINNKKILDEYVNQIETLIYAEYDEQHEIVSWSHDQFNFLVLDTVMNIIEEINLTDRSVDTVSKKILGAQILAPCFKCNMKKVLKWTSTFDIIKSYLLNSKKPVPYGKSWTFSCLLVSLLRSIGIACRNVTYFIPDSVSLLKSFKDKEDIPLYAMSNYYCWVELWHDSAWHSLDTVPIKSGSKKSIVNYVNTKSNLMVEFDHRSWDIKNNYLE
jgi:hypothetical protein